MTHFHYVIFVTAGMMTFYAVEIVGKGRRWLRAAKCNPWRRRLKQCATWMVLIWLGSCVFTHLVLVNLHSGI